MQSLRKFTPVTSGLTLKQQSLCARTFACVLAFVLFAGTCFAPATYANADVRRADVVYGATVDSRGLSVAQCPSIDAEHAFVMSSDGTVYFERGATDEAQIASITKIMTAIVALDAVNSGQATLETQVTVSESAAAVGESSASLQAGDTMTLETALYALLVPSGNDAAVAIAETIGAALQKAGVSGASAQDAFVTQMNTTAAKVGCTNTVYENPHGLDFDEYAGNLHSTARDQAFVVSYAMKNQTFRKIVSGGSCSVSVTRSGAATSIDLETTDEFLELNENAIGVKTGFTDLAGASFAAAVNKDGQELYAIVLNSTSESQRFTDADTLVNWVFEHQTTYTLANSSTKSQYNGETVPVVAQVSHADWLDKTIDATLENPTATVNVFDLNGNISEEVSYLDITGNVYAGQVLGTITFKQRNEVVATQNIVACKNVSAPGFLEGASIWWQRLFKGFSGEQTKATSVLLNETPLINDKTKTTS